MIDRPDLILDFMTEEHGVGHIEGGGALAIGERLEVIPLHVCSCVNLYDEALGVRTVSITRSRSPHGAHALMRGLAGKGVLVTGGTSGIGLATARRFLDEGSRVFVTGIGIEEISAALDGLRDLGEVDGVGGDVSREPDVEAIVERATTFLGRIDVLINNAGIARKSSFLDTGSDDWDRIIAVNLRGMFLVARAVARLMVADRSGGAIVNMASTNALGGERDFVAYNASKGGVPAHEDDGGRARRARHPGELLSVRGSWTHHSIVSSRPNGSSGTTNAA